MKKLDDRANPRMECPHCRAELSLREAITILNGTGFRRMARVRSPDGVIAYIEAGRVNPLAVEILDKTENNFNRPASQLSQG
jgi:hypothetical protein